MEEKIEYKESLNEKIKKTVQKFLKISEDKETLIISHFDTDGITSATIMIQSLKRLDRKFSLKVIKGFEEETIYDLPKNKIIFFLDLASGSLNYLSESNLKNVFIIDHHEIIQKIPENVEIINPQLHNKEQISSSGLTYLFCKEIDERNKEFAKLAVIGMIGDQLEKNIEKMNHSILSEGDILKKRGLLIYPSTRPLNRVLEYSSKPYIPGVTGDIKGTIELLREAGLGPENGKYKTLIELEDSEMEKLVTAVMLRLQKIKHSEVVGDIFLIKLFNKLEDARELSAKINACSRLGEPYTAIRLCMESQEARKKAEAIHVRYKQHLISGLKYASEISETNGRNYLIINAKAHIKDTLIGTISSILSNSQKYNEGTIIIGMALNPNEEKIKVSSRVVGRTGRNLRELLNTVIEELGQGEVGGHEFAAGCLIDMEKEQDFLNILKKNLEMEMVKV